MLIILDDSSESEEDLVLTPTPREDAPYCDWGVCWDILENIGRSVVTIRKERASDYLKSRAHWKEVRWEYRARMCAMNPTKQYPIARYDREYDVMIRYPRMGSDLVKAMKYKYVQKALERTSQGWRLGTGKWRHHRIQYVPLYMYGD